MERAIFLMLYWYKRRNKTEIPDREEQFVIIEIRAKNCFAFEDVISFSLKADMRNKKFASNVYKENQFHILKTAGVYGPNNSGKTCLIKCIWAIKQILLNKKNELISNIFTENSICELGVTFLAEGRWYKKVSAFRRNEKHYHWIRWENRYCEYE